MYIATTVAMGRPCINGYTRLVVDVMVYVKVVLYRYQTRLDVLLLYIQGGRFSALCIASNKGHTEVVELLISRGATVDYQDKVHEEAVNSHV